VYQKSFKNLTKGPNSNTTPSPIVDASRIFKIWGKRTRKKKVSSDSLLRYHEKKYLNIVITQFVPWLSSADSVQL